MAHWDVAAEARGEHGKWTKGGEALKRMAKEAAGTAKEKEGQRGFKEGDKVKYKTGSLGTVHHVDEKGGVHVVWDRGRGKPVRTPAHHLEHQGSEKPAEKASAKPEFTEESWKAAQEKAQQRYTKPKNSGAEHFGGGGMPSKSGRSFEQVHAEYQAKSGTLQRAIDNPGRYGPGVIPANKRDLSKLEEELRGMGARRTSGSNWEMPPKPGTRTHTMEQIHSEMGSIRQELEEQGGHYTAESLLDTRRADIASQLRSGAQTIVVKPPSGSEIQISAATAKYILYGEQPGADMQKNLRRIQQQQRLSEAAGRRGITNRRKMA